MHRSISFSADVGYEAANDFKDKTGLAVRLIGDQVDIANTSDGNVIGILLNEPKKGAGALVRMSGLTTAVLGEAVSSGDFLKPNSEGKLIKTTLPSSTISGILEHYIAIAQESGNANQKITVQVVKGAYTI